MPQGKHYCWSMSQMHSTVSDQGQFILSGSYAHLFINVWRIASNAYQTAPDLVTSSKGATQGDVAAMQMYGILIRPLIDRLGDQTDPMHSKQAWYADDASSTGTIKELYKWWTLLCELGPKFGYYPNSSKTVLIIKNKDLESEAEQLFQSTGIKISAEGDRHLGAVVGTSEFREKFVTEKVRKWVQDVHQLSEIAKDEPQAA